MHQKERHEAISEILRKYGFVTVKFLSAELGYSTATVNRDLNYMEKMSMVHRTYGGVEALEDTYSPLPFRYDAHKSVKRAICKRAASFVEEGDVIFVDASTTTQFLAEYLPKAKPSLVITPNTALAAILSEQGIQVHILGGHVVEAPYFCGGAETVAAVRGYRADKCFLSLGYATEEGEIIAREDNKFLYRELISRSSKSYLLLHRGKIKNGNIFCGTYADFDYVISDNDYDAGFQKKFPAVTFVCVEAREDQR